MELYKYITKRKKRERGCPYILNRITSTERQWVIHSPEEALPRIRNSEIPVNFS